MSIEHDSAATQKTKGARTEAPCGNGITGNIPPNSMVVDTGVLSQLLDGKFETAAKRSENHIDTSIKGLRDEIETLDKKTRQEAFRHCIGNFCFGTEDQLRSGLLYQDRSSQYHQYARNC